jgi:hypothetical protein
MLILGSHAVYVPAARIGVPRGSLEVMRCYLHTTEATGPLSLDSRAQALLRSILADFPVVDHIRYAADPNIYLSLQIQRASTNFCSSVYSRRIRAPAGPEIDRYAKLIAGNCDGSGLELSLLVIDADTWAALHISRRECAL